MIFRISRTADPYRSGTFRQQNIVLYRIQMVPGRQGSAAHEKNQRR